MLVHVITPSAAHYINPSAIAYIQGEDPDRCVIHFIGGGKLEFDEAASVVTEAIAKAVRAAEVDAMM